MENSTQDDDLFPFDSPIVVYNDGWTSATILEPCIPCVPNKEEIMNANEYQKLCAVTARKDSPNRLMVAGLGLTGEAGEVADIIKKHKGHDHPLDLEHLKAELGDVLWYLAEIATCLNVDLGEVMDQNIAKLKRRYPEGFSVDRSINRE